MLDDKQGRSDSGGAILGSWGWAAVGRCDATPEEVDINLKRDPVLYFKRSSDVLPRPRSRTKNAMLLSNMNGSLGHCPSSCMYGTVSGS